MKNLKHAVLAVAALVAVPAIYAQNLEKVTAIISFPFSVNAYGVLPAGTYAVVRLADRWAFHNLDTRESAIVATGSLVETNRDGTAKLTFRCRAEVCALTDMEFGSAIGYHLPARLPRPSAGALLARVIPLGR
jgi:hypothetical protein